MTDEIMAGLEGQRIAVVGKYLLTGGQHRIMISAPSDRFGCGYCNKEGGIAELNDWIESVKAKNNS